ncbi:Histone acetyltransferase HPA2 and related acetyltransferases [hydrothermal vent metagenome]|uniref:Histone acetyltransferase HPA2 and related acetyltransferases n=1 Tax=hydrothermal vent metagenome TaxID=652676 RepID=A0A1W1EEU3_9ZZZZ
MNIEIINVDYSNKKHAKDLVFLLDNYAQDPMGGNESLSKYTKDNLVDELKKIPHAFSVMAYVDDKPAGLINCFEAFSTFKCKKIINIHDLMVQLNFRGLGISQSMLEKVEEIAKEQDCCKITLEVLEGNAIARNSYTKFGFKSYELDPIMGKAMFWEKLLKY